MLGKIQWELGQPIKAVESWRATRQLDSSLVSDEDFKRGLEAAIATAMSVQDYERALALRQELAELAPDHPQVAEELIRDNREKLAQESIRDGQYSQAAQLYGQLLEDYPDQHAFALEKGRLHVELDEHDEAVDAFDHYVDASSTEKLDRSLEVAERAEELEAPEIAVAFYGRALEELSGDPTFRRAKLRLTLASLHYELERPKDGRSSIDAYLDDMRALRGLPLSAEVFMTAADVAAEHGESEYEVQLLERALEKAPPSWNVAAKLAELYARRARSNEVQRVLETFVERSGGTPEAKLQVARWAQDRRNYALAQTFYESVIETVDDRKNVWLELARVYSTLGKLDRLEFALQAYQDKFELGRYELLDVASMYLDHRLYESAEQALLEARELDPKSLVVVDRLAKLYTEWGRPESIHQYYEKWAEARGGDPQDYLLIGDRFIRRGDSPQALPYLERAAEGGADDAWLQIADVYRDQRREIDMKRALAKYLETGETTPSKLRSVLTRYRSAGMVNEQIEILDELLEAEPQTLGHYEKLSQLYFDQGREQDALELWQRYLKRSSDPIDSLRNVSRAFERRGRLPRMLDIYSGLLESGIDDPKIYKLVGDTYLSIASRQRQRPIGFGDRAVGDPYEKARRFYELYLEKADPSDTELRDLADQLKGDRMWELSSDIYERLIDSVPDSSELRLKYAEVLVNLGRVDEAKQIFASYYEARGELLDDAETIATNLVEAKQFDEARPYLDKMFSSGRPHAVEAAFRRFASIYASTGERDEIPTLINQYLENAQNPSRARAEVLSELQSLGLWAEAADQIERIRSFQGDVKGLELGQNLYRAGEKAEAAEALRSYANNNSYSSDAWILVGNFYWVHGERDRAKKAFDQAVSVGPDNAKAYAGRGEFRLMLGEVASGREDFAQARNKTPRSRREEVWRAEIQALNSIGRFELATDAARTAISSSSRYTQYFQELIAERELASPEPIRRQRSLTDLEKSSVSLRKKVRMMARHDFREEAVALLEQELKSGDYVTAAEIVADSPTLFTTLGGYDRLERALKPALEKAGSGARINGRLGSYFLEQGEYQRGIPYLRAAVESGGIGAYQNYRLQLAHAYIAMGFDDGASALLMEQLDDTSAGAEGTVLEVIGQHYEVLGERRAFTHLLRQLLSQPRYRRHAAGMLVRYAADRGELGQALEVIRRVAFPNADTRAESASNLQILMRTQTSERLDTTIGSLEALAAAGYVQEAYELLEAFPEEVQEDERTTDLRMRLAAMHDQDLARAVATRQIEELGDTPEAMSERLRIANILQINGHGELALDFAGPALEASDYTTRQEAARFLIGNAFIADDAERMTAVDEQFLASGPNRLDAHEALGARYFFLGLDDRALEHRKRVSDTFPNPQNVEKTLMVARSEGDLEAYEEALSRFLAISPNPRRTLENAAEQWPRRMTWEFSEPLFEHYEKVYPAVFRGRMNRAVATITSGRVDEGRNIIDGYLSAVDSDRQAVEEVILSMHRAGLNSEVARVARSSRERLTPLANVFAGRSLMELGLTEEARAFFDRYVEQSPDKSIAASNVAYSLVTNDFPQQAKPYAAAAVQAAPGRVEPYFYRGIVLLSEGKTEQARRDLGRSIGPGLSRTSAIDIAAKTALRSDRDAFAMELMRELVDRPTVSDATLGLRVALRTFEQAGRAALGVEFLEEAYPGTAAGDGVISHRYFPVLTLSGLYEAADLPDLAHDTYERIIRKQLATEPISLSSNPRDPGDITTYLNNLAYSYSTTNTHIDRGLEMVKRSLALEESREPSTIDTVGWLYYRAGEYDRALEWVGRSLRVGPPDANLQELLEHMAVIHKLTGDTEKAAWYYIRASGEEER
ncbi:MAG: tetratricopeptide repeat protein [Myxococcota bacterium]